MEARITQSVTVHLLRIHFDPCNAENCRAAEVRHAGLSISLVGEYAYQGMRSYPEPSSAQTRRSRMHELNF